MPENADPDPNHLDDPMATAPLHSRRDHLTRWDELTNLHAFPMSLLLKLNAKWQTDPLLKKITQTAYDKDDRFATARAESQAHLDALVNGTSARWVDRISSGRARYAPQSEYLIEAMDLEEAHALNGTVVAVIDDACAFAHERFRYVDAAGHWQPRIRFLWDQGTASQAPAAPRWRQTKGFDYGRELDGHDIGDLLRDPRCSTSTVIDESRLYELVEHAGVERLEMHGTHVLDLAAGADPRQASTQDEPKIIFVQLPTAQVRDTSGSWLAVNVVDALRYVHQRVRKDAKLVINLSYGAMAGPHDGTSLIEQAIEDLHRLRPKNLAVVLPAGNGFKASAHASAALLPAGRAEFTVAVRADDPTETFVEIWTTEPVDATISVVAPGGTLLTPASPNLLDSAGRTVASVIVPTHVAGMPMQAVLCMRPAVSIDGSTSTSPAGNWRLIAEHPGNTTRPLRIDAWIERDDPARGTMYPSARQAVFVSPTDSLAPCIDGAPIERRGTLNSIAHGASPIVVGACRDADNPEVCDYSGSGPSRGARAGPDVVALGDEAHWLEGIRAAGTRSGHTFRMSGTSVAAPRVTRWLAAWLSAQTTAQPLASIKAALDNAARTHPATLHVRDPCNPTDLLLRAGTGFIG